MLTLQTRVDRVGTRKSEPLLCLAYHPLETLEAAKWHLVPFDPFIFLPSWLAIWTAWRHSWGRGHQMDNRLREAWRKGWGNVSACTPRPQ